MYIFTKTRCVHKR